LGISAGLDSQEVSNHLDSDLGGKEVDEQAKAARNGQESGVPRYTIQGKYKIDGAEDPSAFLDIFQRVKSEETVA
jgi:predicted DsbA family dithiol-disulfide isomerase